MTVKDTSVAAYYSLAKNAREKDVISALAMFGAVTRNGISKVTGIPVNCLTNAVFQLVKRGAIEEFEQVTDTNGRKAWNLRLSKPTTQQSS